MEGARTIIGKPVHLEPSRSVTRRPNGGSCDHVVLLFTSDHVPQSTDESQTPPLRRPTAAAGIDIEPQRGQLFAQPGPVLPGHLGGAVVQVDHSRDQAV